jgi:polyhydroxyalkanoate synthase
VEDVVPLAADRVMKDRGAGRVQVITWSLGGVIALLSVADGRLPASAVAMVGSPFDFAQMKLVAPIRRLAQRTRGAAVTGLYRALGGAPAPLVGAAFKLSAVDRMVTKPMALATHMHDRDWLAHVEAVDDFMGKMIAYPGRTFGQLYHRFFLVNELSGGRITLREHEIDLADVKIPVLQVAGTADVIAPVPAVHGVGKLLTGSPDVRLEEAPGGHLGVLTGRSAERTTWRHIDRLLVDTA